MLNEIQLFINKHNFETNKYTCNNKHTPIYIYYTYIWNMYLFIYLYILIQTIQKQMDRNFFVIFIRQTSKPI